jgi:hypothetical protein
MTAEKRQLTSDEREDLLRRLWLWHDACWFAGVAQEFGMDAANRLNKSTVRALGQTEMRRLMKVLHVERVTTIGGAMQLYDAGRELYVPTTLMDADVGAVTDGSYEVTFNRCFVHENIVRAGIAGTYHCAVFDRLEGWHDAWGLPLAESMPPRTCALAAGQTCRQQFILRQAQAGA